MKTRTGWEDVDALLKKAEELGDELEEIQKEAADILYPEGKKPASPQGRQLVRSA